MILTQRRRAAEEKELDVMNMFVLNFGMATMKEGVCRVANGYQEDPQLCASAALREASIPTT